MANTDLPTDAENLTRLLGFKLLNATRDEVSLEWEVSEKHHQPMGIVHGGVYCAAIETVCSIGASIDATERFGRTAVGLENHTSFIRAVRSGLLRAVAKPITRGRSTQVWEATITNEAGQTLATGRVRLFCVEGDLGHERKD